MHAFLTGSRKYSVPRPESDTDLVVLVSKEDLKVLRDQSSFENTTSQRTGGYLENLSLRFGGLNLICCTEAVSYELWAEGTRRLTERSPVTRFQAVELFDKIRDRVRPTLKEGQLARLFDKVVQASTEWQWPGEFRSMMWQFNPDPHDRFRWGVLHDWLMDHDEPELAHAARILRDRHTTEVRKTHEVDSEYVYEFVGLPASIAVHWSCFGLDVSTLAGALGVLARAILKAKEDVA